MNQREGDYVPIRDVENVQLGMFDKPLPCFGCGIGWFSQVLLPFLFYSALTHRCIFLLLPLAWICFLTLLSWISLFLYSLLLGFVFPLMWYFSAILYFRKYYNKDPKERSGLVACAIAAILFTVAAVITLLVYLL